MARRRPEGSKTRRYFRLEEIQAMRPYLIGLMEDLRERTIRRNHLEFHIQTPSAAKNALDNYSDRKNRYSKEEELEKLVEEIFKLRREISRMGIKLGDVLRGELLFPCRVSYRDAFFYWTDEQERPESWRFKEEDRLRPIPQFWFATNSSKPSRC